MDFPWYVINEYDLEVIAKYENEEFACDYRDEILANNPDINVEVWHYNQYQDAIATKQADESISDALKNKDLMASYVKVIPEHNKARGKPL